MNTETTIDAQEVPKADTQALAVRKPEQSTAITPAQAKVEAVAKLTMSAYERASMLELTKEEVAALIAEFPDEAFQSGAAGKENLIYLEHAYLRDRLSSVFGMGKWAIVPRNRWEETFRTAKGTEAHRVYVEAMLLVRGCFVAEAVGDMVYYPNNDSQNYGDAVEGAKTAALRRCAKELGVGLQAWKKDWCLGWWDRKRGGARPQAPRSQPKPASNEPEDDVPWNDAKPEPPKPTAIFPTEESRKKMIASFDDAGRPIATEFFRKLACILPNEELENIPLRFVPATVAQMKLVCERIAAFESGSEATAPFPPHPEPEAAPRGKSKPIEVPRQDVDDASKEEPWRSFPMPWGARAGETLASLDKKYLYGLWANYQVETEFNGKPKKPETIAKDRKFREFLDDAGTHYNFEKKD